MGLNKNNILIIGGPNVGKTHYGGQLYGRLTDRLGHYSITTAPKDLNVFREVLDALNDGKSAGHTSVNSNTRLTLGLEDINKNVINFSFPDYGGEQVQKIVNERRVTSVWQDDIVNCDSWMIFIRLDQILPIEDVINRGIPDAKILMSREKGSVAFKLSEAAYYTDLLQILLYVKKISLHQKINAPNLTIVLSCWDILTDDERELKPVDLLMKRLPMVFDFINNTWESNAYNVIGLSSTGKTLSDKIADSDYVKKGPEAFGYFIDTDGKKETDLTLTIATAIG